MNYPPYNAGYPPRMEQQPMGQLQNMQQPMMQQPTYVTRPVTSREEAVAVQADVFGLGTLMPDISHGVIYLKRFNPNTGGSDFLTFAVREEPKQTDVRTEVAALRNEVQQLKEMIYHDQSYYNARSGREKRQESPADDYADGETESVRRPLRADDEWQERRRSTQYGREYGE